jgi:large subunit ribosomal protein L29
MANKLLQDLREMTDQDLKGKLEDTQEEYDQLKFDHATKGLDNPLKLRTMRRNIARMQTVLRKRELENASDEELAKRDKIRKRRRRKY